MRVIAIKNSEQLKKYSGRVITHQDKSGKGLGRGVISKCGSFIDFPLASWIQTDLYKLGTVILRDRLYRKCAILNFKRFKD